MSVGSRLPIDTNQYQQGIQRNGGKRVRCHTFNFAVVIHGNYGDARGKTAHRFAEFFLRNGHISMLIGVLSRR
jgi:hypothetical protein